MPRIARLIAIGLLSFGTVAGFAHGFHELRHSGCDRGEHAGCHGHHWSAPDDDDANPPAPSK
jgi:hypothetical protein